MRKAAIAACFAAALVMLTPWVSAQDKDKNNEDTQAEMKSIPATPLKVAVTFVEFEGDRKVKSLPYSLVVLADSKIPKSAVKMGSRVPVYTGKENGMQYLDVGSNIDCVAFRVKEGEFDLRLSLDRSWVEGDVSVPVDKSGSSQTASGSFPEPIVRQFRSDLSVKLRDGQSIESAFATDPLSGKVFKVEVGLTVLK
jgi:hypothetical protein